MGTLRHSAAACVSTLWQHMCTLPGGEGGPIAVLNVYVSVHFLVSWYLDAVVRASDRLVYILNDAIHNFF